MNKLLEILISSWYPDGQNRISLAIIKLCKNTNATAMVSFEVDDFRIDK